MWSCSGTSLTLGLLTVVTSHLSTRSPSDPGHMLVKRVLGLEGDVVGTLPPCPDAKAVIPPGHVWVEGDLDVACISDVDSDLPSEIGDGHVRSDDSNRFGQVRRSSSQVFRIPRSSPPGFFGTARCQTCLYPVTFQSWGPVDRIHDQTSDGPLRRSATAIVEWWKARLMPVVTTPYRPCHVRQ